MVEHSNLAIKVPDFEVVAVDVLSGGRNRRLVVRAVRKGYRALKVAVVTNDVDAIIGRSAAPVRRQERDCSQSPIGAKGGAVIE